MITFKVQIFDEEGEDIVLSEKENQEAAIAILNALSDLFPKLSSMVSGGEDLDSEITDSWLLELGFTKEYKRDTVIYSKDSFVLESDHFCFFTELNGNNVEIVKREDVLILYRLMKKI